MDSSRHAVLRAGGLASSFVALVLLGACQRQVPGSYELDFEETKLEVLKAAQAHPGERHKQEETLKLLASTRLDMRLSADGKLVSTTTLANASMPTPPPRSGQWRQVGQTVTLSMDDGHGHGGGDTSCSVDGKRLRCANAAADKLFVNYVLVRK